MKFAPAIEAEYQSAKMMQPETIKRLIEQGIAGSEVYVEGEDGTHFQAIVVSNQFAGKTRVQQHRVVYQALGDRMGGEIHALSLQTYTPEQWNGVRGLR